MTPSHVAVVGAGWSGLAAATRIAEAGHRVTVVEAAGEPGGRARGVEVDGLRLDNGQHVLLGAYRDTLATMRRIGNDPATAFLRRRLCLDLHGQREHVRIALPPGPGGPALALALLGARGIRLGERVRALWHAPALRRLPATDGPVTHWLQSRGQPRELIRCLWQPLCLAALNTPPERASARLFARVLGEALRGGGASDLLFPRADLGTLFPRPAVDWLRRHGMAVHTGTRVRAIQPGETGWRLHTRAGELEADAVVVATAPRAAARLLQPLGEAAHAMAGRLDRMEAEPIVTVWLRTTTAPARPPAPMLGRLDGPAQWVFDRAPAGQPGILGAVISGDGPHMTIDRATLGQQVARQLAAGARAPEVLGVIRERRATFAATPEVGDLRPSIAGPLPGLWLAGDHVDNGLPATIEGAVRNGHRCAEALLRETMNQTTGTGPA